MRQFLCLLATTAMIDPQRWSVHVAFHDAMGEEEEALDCAQKQLRALQKK